MVGVSSKSGTLMGRAQRTKKLFSADSPKLAESPLLSAARNVVPLLTLRPTLP